MPLLTGNYINNDVTVYEEYSYVQMFALPSAMFALPSAL